MITKDACNTQSSVQGEEVPEDNLSVSNMQVWKKQRLGPACAPVASANHSQDSVVAVKGARGLAGMGRECTAGGPQQTMAGVRGVEVVAEVAEARPAGLHNLCNFEEEATEGVINDTSLQ